nr:multiheme c-type cytochrome [uncultured Carboxylicivirga sp.]
MTNILKYSKIIRILGIVTLMLLPVYLLIKTYVANDEVTVDKADYKGVETCIECHQPEYNEWLQSHHNKAMDDATDSSVLGDFNNVVIEAQGMNHRFFKKDGRFMVNTDGADGTMQDFEVKYVFGNYPLQQYLVEFPGGRLQTLALTWDCDSSRWYHMADYIYAGQQIKNDDWLHWTNQAQNWNSMCADCHSTNLKKGYDHKTDTYNTTWSEINVSCEACHGPASKHLEWASLPEYAQEDIDNYGLVVKTSGIDHTQYVNNCVRCHSRRASLQDFDHHSKNIYDHVIPNLPEDPTWYIDGQILDEDYVYASFMQSKMHMKEVQCNDCHNVHSGKLLFGNKGKQYNQLCAQCHVPDIYDTPEHHFHKTEGMEGESLISESGIKMDVGSGALCINCHMHGRHYMGVDYRRDHSFRIPRPDLTMKYGVPNACNQCHVDKSAQWSENYIKKWFGESRRYHFAEAFSEARREDTSAIRHLNIIAADELYPMSIRALAIQHMGTYFQDSLKLQADSYIHHLYPTIRLAALRATTVQSEEDIKMMMPMLNDETKAVRTETARILLAAGESNVPANYKKSYQKALDEYEQVLIYSADFPTGKFNLGNFYYNQGKTELAVEWYLKTLKQDKELHFVKLNLAHAYNRQGENDKAVELFDDYLKDEPDDANAMYSYGLLLSEIKKYNESLQMLEKSYLLDQSRPRVAHNIAMMYDFMGDKGKAEAYLKKEINLMKDYNSNAGLLQFYLNNGMQQKALSFARNMLNSYPEASQDLNQVIQQLEGR